MLSQLRKTSSRVCVKYGFPSKEMCRKTGRKFNKFFVCFRFDFHKQNINHNSWLVACSTLPILIGKFKFLFEFEPRKYVTIIALEMFKTFYIYFNRFNRMICWALWIECWCRLISYCLSNKQFWYAINWFRQVSVLHVYL